MTNRPHLPAFNAQQRSILELLKSADRYRYELLDATSNDYQALKRSLDPLIAQKLVTYHFSEDAQRFAITPKGREALEPQPQRLSWFSQ
ncbi:hypothetical protein IFO70_10175 [Phormidium tenue FACHB-886]|nr:hypothetical protein [Phormidium tenue FACHB-886]